MIYFSAFKSQHRCSFDAHGFKRPWCAGSCNGLAVGLDFIRDRISSSLRIFYVLLVFFLTHFLTHFLTYNGLLFAAQWQLEGKVVHVLDGDTLDVLQYKTLHRVRLAEVDAPEKQQPWGNQAKLALQHKIHARVVRVDCQTADRYKRCVGRVFLGIRDINKEMLQEGHVWVYRDYVKDLTLQSLELAARSKKLGIFSLAPKEQLQPWLWRKARREEVNISRRARARY